MTNRKSYNDPGHAHFLTFSCYQKRQLLADPLTCEWLAETIRDAREIENFHLWAYVFMPDHIHLLIHPQNEKYSIPRILRRIKEPVTRRVVSHWREHSPQRLARSRTHQGKRLIHRFWQAGGGYDKNLIDMESVRRAIAYIEFNPVRRGLVSDATMWRWSSARAPAGLRDVAVSIDPVMTDEVAIGDGLEKP